jgi:hypothetical protein
LAEEFGNTLTNAFGSVVADLEQYSLEADVTPTATIPMDISPQMDVPTQMDIVTQEVATPETTPQLGTATPMDIVTPQQETATPPPETATTQQETTTTMDIVRPETALSTDTTTPKPEDTLMEVDNEVTASDSGVMSWSNIKNIILDTKIITKKIEQYVTSGISNSSLVNRPLSVFGRNPFRSFLSRTNGGGKYPKKRNVYTKKQYKPKKNTNNHTKKRHHTKTRKNIQRLKKKKNNATNRR